jgi:hypothetical protein
MGRDYAMAYEIDHDEDREPYPIMCRYWFLGLSWEAKRIPTEIRHKLHRAAVAQIKGENLEP